MRVHCSEHTLRPMLGRDENTLNPPEQGVAPVTPLVGDREAPDDFSLIQRNQIEPKGAILKNGFNARVNFVPG